MLMKTKLSVANVLCLIIGIGYIGWECFRTIKPIIQGDTGMFWAALANVAFFTGLVVVEFYLAKRKTAVWMERYHIGLCIVLSMAVITIAFTSYMMASP